MIDATDASGGIHKGSKNVQHNVNAASTLVDGRGVAERHPANATLYGIRRGLCCLTTHTYNLFVKWQYGRLRCQQLQKYTGMLTEARGAKQ